MKLKFWGVRGSLPTPLGSEAIRQKIAAVVQRIRPADLENAVTREMFLSQLPEWLFGTAGGNTSCVQIEAADKTQIVFDAGSGIRELGMHLMQDPNTRHQIHLFFSHFHWDHLQGLPFFQPLYSRQFAIDFYSPEPGLESIVADQMKAPYFPIPFVYAQSKRNFHHIGETPIRLGGSTVSWKKMNHPGGCIAYKITEGKKSIIYSTDTELVEKDFERNPENAAFFSNVEGLILDSQYTLGEAVEKFNWGHSSFSLAVDFALEWNIQKLFLFHHEPTYDDKRLWKNLQSAQWYSSHRENADLEVVLAEEGNEYHF